METVSNKRLSRVLRWSWVIALTASSARAQTTGRDVVVVPGFNALNGQHHVELRLAIDKPLEPMLSVSALEQTVEQQLRQAGLTVAKWTSATSQRPVLQLFIHGGVNASGDVAYDVALQYFLPLKISLMQRVKKVGVFRDGVFGTTSRTRAGATVAGAVTASVDRFVQNAYLKANPEPRRASEPAWKPQDFVVDVKEVMTTYPQPWRANLVVQVAESAPVTRVDATEAAVTFLREKGLSVDTGAYFMSISPQIAVFVDSLRRGDGLFAYTIRVEYRRNADIPPDATRIRLVRAALSSSEGVGLGVASVAKPDILQGIREHLGVVIEPHLEANGIKPK
jgi:hypothetical protein